MGRRRHDGAGRSGKEAPLGIKIVVGLQLLGALAPLAGFLGLLGSDAVLLTAGLLLVAVLQVAIAYGMWHLRPWSFLAFVVFQTINVFVLFLTGRILVSLGAVLVLGYVYTLGEYFRPEQSTSRVPA